MKMHDQMEISLQINDGRLMGGESSVRDLLDHWQHSNVTLSRNFWNFPFEKSFFFFTRTDKRLFKNVQRFHLYLKKVCKQMLKWSKWYRVWADRLVTKMFASRAPGPEFQPHHPHESQVWWHMLVLNKGGMLSRSSWTNEPGMHSIHQQRRNPVSDKVEGGED